jgi:asparagine synthetase B (glutamine-hydrolysing)
MCGIGGIFHNNPAEAVDPQLLVNMAAIQVHRGPDGFGVRGIDDAGVGFCHARLSIIDLNENRARQPFISGDGQLLMAHNGEFYSRASRAPCRNCGASSPSPSTTAARTVFTWCAIASASSPSTGA